MPSDPNPIPFWPQSGFPVQFQFKPVFDAHFGSQGVNFVEVMEVYWSDLPVALQALLGYSYRVGPGQMSRKLPWQHPWANQCYVKDVSAVRGVQPVGNSSADLADGGNPDQNFHSVTPGLGNVGPGYAANQGPWSEFTRALITVQFQRPPYFIRTDADITGVGGQLEWLRYLDRDWKVSDSILSRDAAQFVWSGSSNVTGLPGGLGQVVTKMDLKRRWYEVPEACIFSMFGGVPVGIPQNLYFTQTQTVNPVTGFVWPAGSAMLDTVNAPIGGGASTQAATTNSNTTVNVASTAGYNVGDAISTTTSTVVGGVTVPVIPPGAYITAITPGVSITISVAAVASVAITLNAVSSSSDTSMFGCPTGTLLYKGAIPTPRPLQLPAYLMQIPFFANNEAISQVQYDVDLIFQYFNPQTKNVLGPKGHNLMPNPRDGFWYPVNSQAAFGAVTTPFQYADFSDIFKVL